MDGAMQPTSSGAEMPPEPTIDSLLAVLFRATSANPAAIAQASDYLNELETHPSLWALLLDIAFERSVPFTAATLAQEANGNSSASSSNGGASIPHDEVLKRWSAIRTVAIIRFKNGVMKFWRGRVVKRVKVAVSQDTKDRLRRELFRCLDEPDRGVALQASIAIARIARIDFPTAWPSLFEDLRRAMVEAHAGITEGNNIELNRLVLLRASDVCAKALKEFSTVMTLAGKSRMAALSQQLLPTFAPMFQQYVTESMPESNARGIPDLQRWTAKAESTTLLLAARLRTCYLLLKCVRFLSVADIGLLSSRNSNPDQSHPARQLFTATLPNTLQYVRDVRWAYIGSIASNLTNPTDDDTPVLLALQKLLLLYGKLYIELATRAGKTIVRWEGWDEVIAWYWQEASAASPEELSRTDESAVNRSALMQQHPTRLIIQSLLLLQNNINTWRSYGAKPPLLKEDRILASTTDVLVEKMLMLTRNDLELWEIDAEEWSVAEETDARGLDVRQAAQETMYELALLVSRKERESVIDELLWRKLLGVASDQTDATSLAAVLQKDALYSGLGWGYRPLVLQDHEPYKTPGGEWLSKMIVERFLPEASLSFAAGSSWMLIRRRIVWIIGRWSECIVPAHRAAVYELLVSLLQDIPGKTDAAVRLEAVRCLSTLADDVRFDADVFQPFIDVSLSRLASMVAGSELHEMDSIRTCTNTMSTLIERLGARIAQHLDQLATLVPRLWTLDDPEFKARPSMIMFVGRLVRSVELIPHGTQGAGSSLHGIVEVIVRDSLAPHASAMLGKDALELWIRTLRSSTQMSDPLFRLLDLLPPLLDQPDFSPEACRVAQESTLMSAQAVVATYGSHMFEGFARIVGDPHSPLIMHPIAALSVIVQALKAQEVDMMAWATLLDQSGLMYVLLGSLLKVEDASTVTGSFVALLARIAFIMDGSTIFLELVRSAALRLEGSNSDAGATVLQPMVEAWCSRVEKVSSPRKRKIICLGLAALLGNANPARDPHIFATLPSMIGVWMDLMGDMRQDVSVSGDDVSAPALPTAPPSSPTLSRALPLQPTPELFRRSPSPAPSIPGLEDIDDVEETSPGKGRLTELSRMDPLHTVRLAVFVSDCMRRAQTQGGALFQASLATMDPLVLEIFQKDLSQS